MQQILFCQVTCTIVESDGDDVRVITTALAMVSALFADPFSRPFLNTAVNVNALLVQKH